MFLIMIKGANPGGILLLKKDGVTVAGRAKECDIQLLDVMVSRRHFQIEERSGSFYIKDLGSTNKTYLNKNTLDAEQCLKIGDVIEIGDTALLFTDQKEISVNSVEDYNKIKINQTMRIDLPPNQGT